PAGTIHVAQMGGPGEPVLFVHGFACDATFWSEQLLHVSAGGRRALTITAHQHEGPPTVHARIHALPRRHIAGTSHYIAQDDPAAVNRVLDDALAGWAGATPGGTP